jgi:hypothetical protein
MTVLLPDEPLEGLDAYVDTWDGGQGLLRARDLGPAGVVEVLERSGLRGRGGAGFATGRKWATIRAGEVEVGDRYVVANGAEGEPGTFKDRMLMRRNPSRTLGCAVDDDRSSCWSYRVQRKPPRDRIEDLRPVSLIVDAPVRAGSSDYFRPL